jgi:uncharacterized protein YjlB
MEQERQDPSVERGERRHTARSARSLSLGAVLGAIGGAAIGLGTGVAFLEGAGVWAVVLAVSIAGALLGAFWGGMSSLESPDPGTEPSETEHPIRDVATLTHDEGEGERGADEPERR